MTTSDKVTILFDGFPDYWLSLADVCENVLGRRSPGWLWEIRLARTLRRLERQGYLEGRDGPMVRATGRRLREYRRAA